MWHTLSVKNVSAVCYILDKSLNAPTTGMIEHLVVSSSRVIRPIQTAGLEKATLHVSGAAR
jgi:hypothetical protein